jgi:hypothetical protein
MSHPNRGWIMPEDPNALLERQPIAKYLKPCREVWPSLSEKEKRQLLVEACTWASCVLANPAAAGVRGGFYGKHR